MRQWITGGVVRWITGIMGLVAIAIACILKGWSDTAVIALITAVVPAFLAASNHIKSKAPLMLLAIMVLAAGCTTHDARQLSGRAAAVSQTLHVAVVSFDDGEKLAGVSIEKRRERFEAVEKILQEYRAYELILKGYAQALEAAEASGDCNTRDAINARARAQAELAARVAARAMALLIPQQEAGAR